MLGHPTSMSAPQESALASAVACLGAVEVAPGRYAFADGWTGCGDGKRWLLVSSEGLACLPRTGYHAWRSKWTKPAPSWWTPDSRFAWRVHGVSSPFVDRAEAERIARSYGHRTPPYRITADLETGEEVLA